MTVAELMESLASLDANLEVVCYTEAPINAWGRERHELKPTDVYATDVTVFRDDAGFLNFKYERGEGSRRVAWIELSPDM